MISSQFPGHKDSCLLKYFCFTEPQFPRHNEICLFSLACSFSICSRWARLLCVAKSGIHSLLQELLHLRIRERQVLGMRLCSSVPLHLLVEMLPW